MSPKHPPETPVAIRKKLLADGWTERGGKGDHRNFRKPGHGVVTLDMGVRDIPAGTLRNIYRVAGWAW